jgi:hypothetical protein
MKKKLPTFVQYAVNSCEAARAIKAKHDAELVEELRGVIRGIGAREEMERGELRGVVNCTCGRVIYIDIGQRRGIGVCWLGSSDHGPCKTVWEIQRYLNTQQRGAK